MLDVIWATLQDVDAFEVLLASAYSTQTSLNTLLNHQLPQVVLATCLVLLALALLLLRQCFQVISRYRKLS